MLALTGCNEAVRNNYPTLIDAKSEIEKGWIPRALPASTVDICESHDLDVNTGSGTFSFAPADVKQFESSLVIVGDDESLRGIEVDRQQLKRDGFDLYKFEDFYLAVNWTQCRGQFWLKYSK